MTKSEARTAVRLNSIVETAKGLRGYAYQLIWTHERGCASTEQIGVHDLRAAAVYIESVEAAKVIDWNAPALVVETLMKNDKMAN